jgi:hypothetical protein
VVHSKRRLLLYLLTFLLDKNTPAYFAKDDEKSFYDLATRIRLEDVLSTVELLVKDLPGMKFIKLFFVAIDALEE